MNPKKICIVGGCGHVGLPLGIVLAEEGYEVTLYDIAAPKVDLVNDGVMPFLEEGGKERLKQQIKSGRLKASTQPETILKSDTVILTTGTPVDEYLNPKLGDVMTVLKSLCPYLTAAKTIILRSTLFPGASEMIAGFMKNSGVHASVTFCPERIAQGKALEEIRDLPQIISAFDDRGYAAVEEIFGKIAKGRIVRLSPIEAELAKLFCNVWRYINFSISNQFFQIAHRAGADFSKIHEAATFEYPRMRAFAKAGFAAGPCLFKDTMQLAAFSHNTFFLGHSAMLVNEGMPAFTVQMLKEKLGTGVPLSGMRVSILGMTFKRDNDDIRDSLSFKLRKLLEIEGAEVVCHDPYLTDNPPKQLTLVNLEEALQSQALIIGTPHSVYDDLDFGKGQTVIDIWGITRKPTVTHHKTAKKEIYRDIRKPPQGKDIGL